MGVITEDACVLACGARRARARRPSGPCTRAAPLVVLLFGSVVPACRIQETRARVELAESLLACWIGRARRSCSSPSRAASSPKNSVRKRASAALVSAAGMLDDHKGAGAKVTSSGGARRPRRA